MKVKNLIEQTLAMVLATVMLILLNSFYGGNAPLSQLEVFIYGGITGNLFYIAAKLEELIDDSKNHIGRTDGG